MIIDGTKISEKAETLLAGPIDSVPVVDVSAGSEGSSKTKLNNILLDRPYIHPFLAGDFVSVCGSIATGTVDLYTVPSGKRLCVTTGQIINASGSTINGTFYWQAYINGSYRRISSTSFTLTNGTFIQVPSIILEAGEKLSCYIGTSGVNVVFRGFLFDSTIPFHSPRLFPTSANAQTLLYAAQSTTIGLPIANLGIPIIASNTSGSSITYYSYLRPKEAVLPHGVSPNFGIIVSNNAASSIMSMPFILNSGDEIYVTASSNISGQLIWCTVFELPY